MKTKPEKIAVCICTYKRPQLLRLLLEDIASQERRPSYVIVVDGDPGSGEVSKALRSLKMPGTNLFYQPSNHANLAYQRYLGWKIAESEAAGILVYFDDDLRLPGPHVLGTLASTLEENPDIAGASAPSLTGSAEKFKGHALLQEQRKSGGSAGWMRYLGGSGKLPSGGLTSYGQRKMPDGKGSGIENIEWLQGRVMVYSMKALRKDCFTEDLFAMTHIKCGLGEDTLLSRRVRPRGRLVWVRNAAVEHPDDDLPNSYPIRPYAFGFATAYSRRLLNDYFRGFEKPCFGDRLDLIKTYFGNLLVHWFKIFWPPQFQRVLFASGYTKGVFCGLFRPPRSQRLTPAIRWQMDAESAFQSRVNMTEQDNRAA